MGLNSPIFDQLLIKHIVQLQVQTNQQPLTASRPDSPEVLRSPKRQSSTVYEKVCAKLSRSGLKSSLSTPSLKKAPLATEDHLDDLEGAASEAKDSEVKDSEVKIVHLRPHQRSHNQRRCQSEVTPSKTAELLVSSKQKLFRYLSIGNCTYMNINK